MKNWQSYIEKQKPEFMQTKLPSVFASDIIVVIPCYDESNLIATLDNLCKCDLVTAKISVIIIINSAIHSSEQAIHQNRKTYIETVNFAQTRNSQFLQFFPLIFEDLPRKHAGVGLARRIGMDLAIEHFRSCRNFNGIIVSLDADCMVSPNYFTNILTAYQKTNKTCCTVHNFKHRVENNDSSLENAIRQYETHIRYFSNMLMHIGFPYYYHTIGSAFSVSAEAYVRVGGMGRQQGGEDFYFLQKVFALEKTKQLDDVFVFPLARYSERIPFGTGPAIKKIIEDPDGKMKTYQFESFLTLKELFDLQNTFFKDDIKRCEHEISMLHPAIAEFSKTNNLLSEIVDCKKNCATFHSFQKRFFHHFNAFKIIKYLNFAHQNYFEMENINIQIEKLKTII